MTVPTPLQLPMLYKDLDDVAKQELPAGAAQAVHTILLQGYKLMRVRAKKGRNAPLFRQKLFEFKNSLWFMRSPLRRTGELASVVFLLAAFRAGLPACAHTEDDLQVAMDLDAIIEMAYEQWELR
jgi:hypothetical protein